MSEQRLAEQCDVFFEVPDDFRVSLDDVPNLDDDTLRYVADRAGSMAVKRMKDWRASEAWDALRYAALDELERRGIRCESH